MEGTRSSERSASEHGATAGPRSNTLAVTAAAAPCSPSRLPLDRIGLACGTLSQLVVLLAQGSKAQGTSSWERLQPVLVLAAWLAELLLALRCGALYARHRGLCISAFRLVHFSLPSYRHPGVGAALVMTAPPQAGAWGATLDTFRLLTGGALAPTTRCWAAWAPRCPAGNLSPSFGAGSTAAYPLAAPARACHYPHGAAPPPSCVLCVCAGTRLVTLAMQSAWLLLPPAPTLAMQAVLLSLVLHPRAYCSLPLLRHPLFQRRLTCVAAALEVASLPVESLLLFAGRASSSAALLAGRAQPEAVCRATLAWGQVMVGLLPFFLSLHWWRRGASAHGSADELAGGGAAREGGDDPHGHAECGRWRRLAWRAGRLSTRCSSALHRLFCPGAGPQCGGGGLLAAYLLCLYVWAGSKLAAGLG
ncbi:hypothetical protein ABPG75_008376 [Micractinium tetrahymenae]